MKSMEVNSGKTGTATTFLKGLSLLRKRRSGIVWTPSITSKRPEDVVRKLLTHRAGIVKMPAQTIQQHARTWAKTAGEDYDNLNISTKHLFCVSY